MLLCGVLRRPYFNQKLAGLQRAGGLELLAMASSISFASAQQIPTSSQPSWGAGLYTRTKLLALPFASAADGVHMKT
jgi:hypothetical protein